MPPATVWTTSFPLNLRDIGWPNVSSFSIALLKEAFIFYEENCFYFNFNFISEPLRFTGNF
jgi:hypothetical protein